MAAAQPPGGGGAAAVGGGAAANVTTLADLRNSDFEEYQRIVALACGGTIGGVNAALTQEIAYLPNLSQQQRDRMFADALVAAQLQQAQGGYGGIGGIGGNANQGGHGGQIRIRKWYSKVVTLLPSVAQETFEQLYKRIPQKLKPSPFGAYFLESIGGDLEVKKASSLVVANTTYVVCPRYFRVQFKNVGHMNQNYFRRAVRDYCKATKHGCHIMRQGRDPFYDILFYSSCEKVTNEFGNRLLGPNWKVAGNEEKDEKQNEIIPKPLASKTGSYLVEIGEEQLLLDNEYNDTWQALITNRIIPSPEAPNDNNRLTADDTEASSKASSTSNHNQMKMFT